MWLLVLFQNLQSSKIPLVAGHLGEGLLELLVDRLELLLLGDQLVLQSVHLHQKRRVTLILQWNKRRVGGWRGGGVQKSESIRLSSSHLCLKLHNRLLSKLSASLGLQQPFRIFFNIIWYSSMPTQVQLNINIIMMLIPASTWRSGSWSAPCSCSHERLPSPRQPGHKTLFAWLLSISLLLSDHPMIPYHHFSIGQLDIFITLLKAGTSMDLRLLATPLNSSSSPSSSSPSSLSPPRTWGCWPQLSTLPPTPGFLSLPPMEDG